MIFAKLSRKHLKKVMQMSVKIILNDDKIIVLEMKIPLEVSMLNGEEQQFSI